MGLGDQLWNMIMCCIAFSSGKDGNSIVFRELFSVNPEKVEALGFALKSLGEAANGIRCMRNIVCHNLFALNTPDFESLTTCAQRLLFSLRDVLSCIDEQLEPKAEVMFFQYESALAQIDGHAGIVVRVLERAFWGTFQLNCGFWMKSLAWYIRFDDNPSVMTMLKRVVDSFSIWDFSSLNFDDCIAFLKLARNPHTWKEASLPPVPVALFLRDESTEDTCKNVLEFIRAVVSYGYCRISRIRVMMVGLGEVGKTRLVKALQSKEFKSIDYITKENRTIAADISKVVLNPQHSDPLTACIWDFAGQEVYLMAHSLFMSPRAIYVLVWKRPDECTDDPNAFEPAKAGLRRWLEMICLHVPGAKVLIVGTHCDTPGFDETLQSYRKRFVSYTNQIKSHVRTAIDELNAVFLREDHEIAQKMSCDMKNDSLLRRRALLRGIRKPLSEGIFEIDIASNDVCQMIIDDRSFFEVDSATGTGVENLNMFLDTVGRQLTADVDVPKTFGLIEKCMTNGNTMFGDVLSIDEATERFVQCFQEEILDSLDQHTAAPQFNDVGNGLVMDQEHSMLQVNFCFILGSVTFFVPPHTQFLDCILAYFQLTV
jgi:GTPase SAR1 family protein